MFWLDNGHLSDILDIHEVVYLSKNLWPRRYSRAVWQGVGDFGDYLAKTPNIVPED